jgi:2-oxo-hept-3-ene-1,7-dioate hydratase
MFSPELTRQLATELQQAQDTRTQLEHFSKRFPAMTVEDGYRISRAWVALQLAQGRKIIGHKIGLTSRAARCSTFRPRASLRRGWRWNWPSC